ncbi:MAG: FAD/NAD(P)-binding protein [Candidatus Eremiobacteraeota bacterium]|nr:FAD/NAD(P)-binding protein [Candidatus Eremiobacteraeota bacterium]MBV8371810.1 FAD/NAD(P)-binding protein [Candidatus Eremiobacteraeota bacterium]
MTTSRTGYDVAIIGAGFCGTMVAVHLADEPRVQTVIFERDTFARGLAYATESPRHLLNLAAARMSALPDTPGSFVDYLGDGDPGAFAPRRDYAAYLRGVFERATAERTNVARRHASVVALQPTSDDFRLTLDSGQTLQARNVVLAIGLFPPSDDMVDESARQSPHYLADPWSLDFDALFGNVLTIGTGLTAIDVLVELHHRGFEGTVTALSRHGLLPQPHAPYGEALQTALDRHGARATFRSVRKAIAGVAKRGGDWRAVVDGVRPQSQEIWQGWSLREKQRFLRHLRPYWETSRRRVPPEAYRTVVALQREGRFRRVTGRIRAIDVVPHERFRVETEHAGDVRHLDVDWIVNCTGPRNDVTKINDPLVRSLLRQGLIAPHPTGLGIQATPRGRVIRADGTPSHNLFATGSLLRGVLYESVSVAELSGQMQTLAQRLRATVLETKPG